MPRPADTETVTFRKGAAYWGAWRRQNEHGISPDHIRKLGRKMGLITTRNLRWSGKNADPLFPVPKSKYNCKAIDYARGWYAYNETRYCTNDHTVKATQVYDFCVDKYDMTEKGLVTEKVVEKVVEKRIVIDKVIEVPKGYVGTFEKREVLAFALTRELRGTEKALRQAYIDNDADESLRLAARVDVIREVMADLDIDLIEGAPQIVVARSFSKTGGLFDGLRAGPDHT